MSDELVLCVNRTWTMEHLVDPQTKKTPCGLKWRKGRPRKRHVWIPMALFFQGPRQCRRCFADARCPSWLKPRKKKKVKKVRTRHH